MAKVKVYNQKGEAAGEIELAKDLFEVAVDPNLIHEAVVIQQSNARQAIAHAKDRSEVRGGGRKPWRQKGTGRARAGTIRSPLWRSGGVTFGPNKDQNFARKINKKAKRKALAMTLSDKVTHDRFVVVDTLELSEAKTKIFAQVLSKMPSAGKKTLVVIDPANQAVKRVARNIPKVDVIGAKSLNVVDVLSHDYILISKDVVELVNETYKVGK